MAKQQRHSAETILDLINSLSPEERSKLFRLLAPHPDNKPYQELHESYCLLAKSTIPKLEKFHRGPRVKMAVRKARKEVIRQFRNAGITDPKKILEKLCQDFPGLAEVGTEIISIKTIKNILSELNKS